MTGYSIWQTQPRQHTYMFNAATNFVIQNGVFIEMKDNAKLYAKKLLNPARDIQLSNYRRIRRGDIHLQEQIWNVEVHGRIGNVWDEYVVEVSAESKSKVARIYQGRDAYALFKRELEVLSKLWIRQIFGVYESNDVFGFVYHDDGMRRRYNEYVLHLNTLQRVAFSIKYSSDIRLHQRQVNRQMRYYTLQGELHDTLSHTAPNCIYFMDIYVDAYGRLSTVLSIREPSPVHYGIDYEGTASAVSWDRQRITQLSKGNLELIWPLLNNSRVDLQLRHEKKRLISAWNSALLSVKKKISFAMKYNAEYLLGHPVVLWFSGPELDIVNDVLYISGCSGDMFKRDVKPQTSWRIVEDIFHSHVVRVSFTQGKSHFNGYKKCGTPNEITFGKM
ncbi:hypothetical protein BDQ17DRAFT_1332813 [Cyathus striatus]|nr:hypothetical protein BDQ17DRAFT_1332813 [Cyathus striatus]